MSAPARPAVPRRWMLDVFLGLALPLAIGLSQLSVWRSGPAIVYVWAAGEMQAGRFRPQLYDDAYALQAVADFTHGQARDILSPTPPTMFVLMLPFVWLPAPLSAGLWLALDMFTPLLAAWLALRAMDVSSLALAGVCAALVLMSMPLWENSARGQVLHWQMLLAALVLYALARGRAALAGAGLGLIAVLKLAGWPVWGLLALRGRWQALGWVALTGAAVALLSLPLVHLDTWLYYLFTVLPHWLQAPVAVVPAYQTVAGFWQHLLRFDPSLNPAPLANRPRLAAALSLSSTLALLGITFYGLRRASLLLAAGAALVLTVILAPIAEEYHYLTLVPVLIIASVAWVRSGHRFALGLLLFLSAVLMFWPLPYKDPRLAAGWRALLAYPRLWGGLLLWGGLYALARLPGPARRWVAVPPVVTP
jgi:hypothetical protein